MAPATAIAAVVDYLDAEPRQTAVKGWSVSSTRAIDKGQVVAGAPPLLVHQTLANRKDVLVCATCHRFVGTEATQLAMLEGLPKKNATNSVITRGQNKNKKRTRDGEDLGSNGGRESDDSGGTTSRRAPSLLSSLSSPSSVRVVTAIGALSRRLAVAETPSSDLPDLPALLTGSPEGHSGRTASSACNGGGRGGATLTTGVVASREASLPLEAGGVPTAAEDDTVPLGVTLGEAGCGREEGGGGGGSGIYRCAGGAPCDDVYCSAGCRAEAVVAGGHGLICAGGKEEGSPIYEFRRYAVRTSETYLIAAAAIASALSVAEGTRPFEALAGWDEPLPRVEEDEEDGEEGNETAEGASTMASIERNGGGGGSGGGGVDVGDVHGGGATRGIGVPLEEAEEAWSMLAAGLAYGRDSRWAATSETPPAAKPETGGSGGGGRALTLDFFLRIVRALGRHLAPISVPSPLVGYCAQLVNSQPEVRARALPWLSSAIERAGPYGGAANYCEEGDAQGFDNNGGGCEEGDEEEGEEEDGRGGKSPRDNEGRTMAAERGLCRLVQASASAASGAAAGPFPPLAVVGLLPPHCCPEHSCVPNVQLEASMLTASSTDDDDADPPAMITAGSCALRVGFVTLRAIRAGDKLFAPYVALGQPVDARRRELFSIFSSGGQSSSRMVCRCPRCLLEADGDRSLGPEMLKILADQALEEGRHKSALDLYEAALACPSPLPSFPSSSSSKPPPPAATTRHVGDVCSQREGTDIAASSAAAAAAEVKGDALHGVGVAMLAAGHFRDAVQAWERGFQEEPTHPSLGAQAEKEAAYRPADVESRHNQKRFKQDTSALVETRAAKTSGNGNFVRGGYDAFTSTHGGAADIFMSRAPVLSPEECRDVIQAAGDHARMNGGWTTSRHYAVPTTDLPMHALTPLLPWFRSLLSVRLFPSLAEHFDLAGGAGSVFVHDAFVVRYEEGKQRHLPLHRDQSTHSFTIALNSTDEYSGGGTFFPCLGRALRPPEGHALSFRGGILHGGDPLLKGVRYIIACFCYHDNNGAQVGRFGSISSRNRCGTTNSEETRGCGLRVGRTDGGGAGDNPDNSPGDSPDSSLDDSRRRSGPPDGTGSSSSSSSSVVPPPCTTSSGREKNVGAAAGFDGEQQSRLGVVESGEGSGGWEDEGGGVLGTDVGRKKKKSGIEFCSDQAFSFGFGFGDT